MPDDNAVTAASPPPWRRLLRRRTRPAETFYERWGIALFLVALTLIGSLLQGSFGTADNLRGIVNEAAFLSVAAVGMTLAIMSGVFDLSVGGSLALASVLSLQVLGSAGLVPALLAAVAVGTACGAVNGVLVAWVRIPAFIATLATAFIFRGVTFLVSQGGPVRVPTELFGGVFTGIGTTDIGGVVPVPFVITVAAFGVGWFVLRQTGFGRHVLAVGSNEEAAAVCGISPNRVRFATLTILGAFVGVASILLTTQVWTADGGTQQGFELQVIAIVVLGGTSLFGGRGTLLGTFAAALLLTAVQNFMLLSEVPVFYQRIVSGLILLLALSIDGLRQRVSDAGGALEVLRRLSRLPRPARG